MALIALAGPALAQHALPIVPGDAVVGKGHPLFQGGAHRDARWRLAHAWNNHSAPQFSEPYGCSPHTYIYRGRHCPERYFGIRRGRKVRPQQGRDLEGGLGVALKSGQQHFVWTTSEETVVQDPRYSAIRPTILARN